jgi:hypothetical protein
MLASITGREKAAKLKALQRSIDRAIPRPTGLDCLALKLRSHHLGDIVILGGRRGVHLSCGSEVSTTESDAVDSLSEALLKASPFAQAKVVEGCLEDGNAQYGLSIKTGLTVRVVAGDKKEATSLCTEQEIMPDLAAITNPDSLGKGDSTEARDGKPENPSVPAWAARACELPVRQTGTRILAPSSLGKVSPITVFASGLVGFLLGWIFMGRRWKS